MKQNKRELFITSLVTLSPIVIGLLIYERLPEEVAIHFNLAGQADNFMSKNIAIFVIPVVALVIHLLTYFMLYKTPKTKDMNKKVLHLSTWLLPILSLGTSILIYANALQVVHNSTAMIFSFIACFFIVIGNYLPKCEQNYIVGIKTPWALADERNWRATHRFSGPLWVICGGVMLVIGLFQFSVILYFVMLGVIIIIPFIYSYWYSRRG